MLWVAPRLLSTTLSTDVHNLHSGTSESPVDMAFDSAPDRGDFPDHPEHGLRVRLLRRRDTRQPNDELASAPRAIAERLDPSAVELPESAHECETDAEPALRVIEPARALRGQVEHVRDQIERNADAGVGNADYREVLLAADANADRAARRGVLDRVRQEIRDDLVEPRRVGARPDRLGPNVDDVTLEPTHARQVAHRPLNTGRQVQWLTSQDDVSAGDVGDIEEIVDQPAEVGDLVANCLPREPGDVVLTPDTVENADRADDGRERVPQLVAQHRQEFVLRPVGGLCLGACGLRAHQQMLALLLDAPALFDERPLGDDHDGHGAHEDLQQQKRLVRRHAREGPEAAERLPDRDTGQDRDQHRRLALLEADGGPDERRRAEERERERHEPEVGEAFAEHRQPDESRDEPEGSRLEQTAARRAGPPVADQQDQERRDDQRSGRVAEPPGEPDAVEIGPLRVPAEREAADADGRADDAAQERRERGELEDILGVVERPRPVGVSIDEVRAEQPLERVARGDRERGRRRASRADVHDERTHEDRRPDAIAERQERREGDTRRRPDRRRARVDEREGEPDLAGEDVATEEHDQIEWIFAIGEHKRVRALVPAGSVRTGPTLRQRLLLWLHSKANATPICVSGGLLVRRRNRRGLPMKSPLRSRSRETMHRRADWSATRPSQPLATQMPGSVEDIERWI